MSSDVLYQLGFGRGRTARRTRNFNRRVQELWREIAAELFPEPRPVREKPTPRTRVLRFDENGVALK